MSTRPLCATVIAACLAATAASAKNLLDLPRESQKAQAMQRIGITDITVTYSRPLVKGRKIFGKLLPWGDVWRAGANENTTVAFSKPVTVEGKALAAGIYGLFMIPTETDWTVIFSSVSEAWGSSTYKQAEDALRVHVKPRATSPHEELTYSFEELKPDQVTMTLSWEKTAVPIKVSTNVDETTFASVRIELRGIKGYQSAAWDEAASYLLEHHGDLDEAMKDSDESVRSEERFENLLTRSRLLAAKGKKDEAASTRDRALALARPEQVHSFGRGLQLTGKQEDAFELFRANIKRAPNHWAAHNESARMAVARGDYPTAVKEMKLALAAVDPSDSATRPGLEALVKKLEAREDINP